jgi:hypothetical protein
MFCNESEQGVFLSLRETAQKHGGIFLCGEGWNPYIGRQELFQLSPLIGIQRVKNRTNTES